MVNGGQVIPFSAPSAKKQIQKIGCSEVTEGHKYTLLMLQKITTVLENWLIGHTDGEAVELTLKDEQGNITKRIFPASIAESVFGNLLNAQVVYTTKKKISGKHVGDNLPNTAGMVWLVEESHTLAVMSGTCAGVSFEGTQRSLSSEPL